MIFSLTYSIDYECSDTLVCSSNSLYDLWRKIRDDSELRKEISGVDDIKVHVFADNGDVILSQSVFNAIEEESLGEFRRVIMSNEIMREFKRKHVNDQIHGDVK